MSRKKIGAFIGAVGFVGLLFWGSAIDGPDNPMGIVYAGCIISTLMMWIGSNMDEVKE